MTGGSDFVKASCLAHHPQPSSDLCLYLHHILLSLPLRLFFFPFHSMAGDDDSNSLAGNSPPGSPLICHSPTHLDTQSGTEHESRQTTPLVEGASGRTPTGSTCEEMLSSPGNATYVVGSKHPSPDGDYSQFAGLVTWHFKLKKTDHDKLIRVSKVRLTRVSVILS